MEDENDLKDWAIEMAKRGFGQTPDQIKAKVKRILDLSGRKETLFKNNLPAQSWWYSFQSRHPDIKTVLTEKLELSRALAWRPEKIRKWFEGYIEITSQYCITRASQVYNADESGFALQNKSSGKVSTQYI